jgi:hypothetical protein
MRAPCGAMAHAATNHQGPSSPSSFAILHEVGKILTCQILIESICRFIKDQHFRTYYQVGCKSEPLTLPTGKCSLRPLVKHSPFAQRR